MIDKEKQQIIKMLNCWNKTSIEDRFILLKEYFRLVIDTSFDNRTEIQSKYKFLCYPKDYVEDNYRLLFKNNNIIISQELIGKGIDDYNEFAIDILLPIKQIVKELKINESVENVYFYVDDVVITQETKDMLANSIIKDRIKR